MTDFAAPVRGGRSSACRQHHECPLQRQLGDTHGGEKLAIQLGLALLAAAVLDGLGRLFGQSAVIRPVDRGRASQRGRLFQQARHHPHRIPQQRAVGWRMHQRFGDRAVDANHHRRLKPGLPGALHHGLIDRLPTGRGDRADGLLQHGLLGVQPIGSRAKARNDAESSR